jgi:exoribonuclease-2
MPNSSPSHIDLQAVAQEVMRRHGFNPVLSLGVQKQLMDLRTHPPQIAVAGDIRDLRDLLWSSVDNDTSRDLDQIEVAEQMPGGDVKVLIGIADVDAFVSQKTAIDQHAATETTTVYAGVRNFPMLPEELSTGKTSLLENQDCLSVVVDFGVDSEGLITSSDVYRALVRNHAQLAYTSVGSWLEGTAAAPAKVGASTELQAQLRMQNGVAQKLKNHRFRNGALNLQTDELQPLLLDENVVDLDSQRKNLATELIEDFMIAANGVVARMLDKVSSLRRIVQRPERWDRIVQLAAGYGEQLPTEPSSKALNDFLLARKAADPDHFADLSLAVIKLIGPGEYILERPGDKSPGHFGLAVQDYTHSTAPNRRFPDIVTQRLIKAVLAGQPNPYTDGELAAIAAHCTERQDAARKVEREMSKRLAAVAMQNRIGDTFDAIVTGVTPHGTFVRILQPRVEGLLVKASPGIDVGDRLGVKLIRTDVQQGFIDFVAVH